MKDYPAADVHALCQDHAGNIWVGSGNGLALFDPSTNTFTAFRHDPGNPYSLIANPIYDIREMKDGKLWVASDIGGISILDLSGIAFKNPYEVRFRRIDMGRSSHGLSSRNPRSLLQDSFGNVWIGHYGSGVDFVSHIGPEFRVLPYVYGRDAVNGLFMDKRGGIWAATCNGLGYIPDPAFPEHVEHYGYEEGLKDIFVRAMMEDLDGNLWLSTNNGISRWNKETGRFENYDYQDGIPSGNFIENSVCRTADGKLYFGSLGGVCYFNPERLAAFRQVPEVKIVECTQLAGSPDGQVVENVLPVQRGRVEIPYRGNSFRISFSVSDYAQSSLVEYAYQIEGLVRH